MTATTAHGVLVKPVEKLKLGDQVVLKPAPKKPGNEAKRLILIEDYSKYQMTAVRASPPTEQLTGFR